MKKIELMKTYTTENIFHFLIWTYYVFVLQSIRSNNANHAIQTSYIIKYVTTVRY